MKIEGNDLGSIQGRVADRAGQAGAPADASNAADPSAASTDQLSLSPEAQLVREAAKLAAAMPDIRQDVVDAMKAELAAGNIGNDPLALADALINSSLTKP